MTSSSWSSKLRQALCSTTHRVKLEESQLQFSCTHMTLLGCHHVSLCGSKCLTSLFWLKLSNHCYYPVIPTFGRGSGASCTFRSTFVPHRGFVSILRFRLATVRLQWQGIRLRLVLQQSHPYFLLFLDCSIVVKRASFNVFGRWLQEVRSYWLSSRDPSRQPGWNRIPSHATRVTIGGRPSDAASTESRRPRRSCTLDWELARRPSHWQSSSWQSSLYASAIVTAWRRPMTLVHLCRHHPDTLESPVSRSLTELCRSFSLASWPWTQGTYAAQRHSCQTF